MTRIDTIDALEAAYGPASPRSLTKVSDHVTPTYARWIERSRFAILATVGPEGTDASPRGDDGPVVRIAEPRTLLMPDWRGNNRLDSLRNIVTDGRVSLMFMVTDSETVVRVNGTAILSVDPELTRSFAQRGRHPATVIVMTVGEVYFQCAKALMRSALWSRGGQDAEGLPTAGDFLKEQEAGFDAEAYDTGYAADARTRMW